MTALPDLPRLDDRVRALRGPVLAELKPRRRRAPLRSLAAATLAVAALALVLVTRGPAPALAVERQDGWLVLTIADAAADPDELTRELREAGVNGVVRTLPVPPENVGTWAVISETAGTNGEAAVRLDRVDYQRETLRIPIADVKESTGTFLFYVGREANAGETLWWDGEHGYKP